ncbi:MAG: M15 family metallopeptidase [Cyclobacteriaceae bacterium]
MNTKEYCDQVEAKDRFHKKLEQNFIIKDNGSPLVSLKDCDLHLIYEPSIMKGYRYLVREELVEKIARISECMRKKDKTLVIRSAWRSFRHQRVLWEQNFASIQKKYPSKKIEEINEIVSYYISPEYKSTHSTGGALDAMIYDQKNNRILDFGTNKGYEIELSKKCYPFHPEISQQAKENRKLLIEQFESEDFVCDMKEYWHFDYGNIGWAIEKGKDCAFFGTIEKVDPV